MLELKSKSKLTFLLVMLFVVTLSVSLMVFAANKTGSYYQLGGQKLCDYSISANLPVARYDGANEWLLQSSHALGIQSYGKGFDYRFGWGHGWCPVNNEGTWTDCDEKWWPDPQPRSINANSSVSHSYYGWWYCEYADVNQYKAVSASVFKPEDYSTWTDVSETKVVNR